MTQAINSTTAVRASCRAAVRRDAVPECSLNLRKVLNARGRLAYQTEKEGHEDRLMRRALLACVFLLGTALGAHAATLIFDDTTGQDRSDAAVQQALSVCDGQAGVQKAYPSAQYRQCMQRQGWRFSHL